MTSHSPVRIRTKKLSNGDESIYLDIYYGGKRKYEFLHLYIKPGTDRKTKAANKETMAIATQICARRALQVASGEYKFDKDNRTNDITLVEYYTLQMNLRQEGTRRSWQKILNHLRNYGLTDTMLLKDITIKWLQGFILYLNNIPKYHITNTSKSAENPKQLSQITQHNYYHILMTVLIQAYREELIPRDLSRLVPRMPQGTSRIRTYLTLEELRMLTSNTKATPSILVDAFVFACLTGMRWSDVTSIKHKQIIETPGQTARIIYTQTKTRNNEYLDINKAALEIARRQTHDDTFVFGKFMLPQTANWHLKKWAERAGIKKHIHFHVARHTFATLQLELGTDIYTVSKLLGHKDIKTTQIYAKVLDKAKREAVNRIPDIFAPPQLPVTDSDQPHHTHNNN